ncbi:MAG TPA: transporter substrate-binding domain-containing protein [Azospirillaceae bacterium]|nr:transporter substrate-binding domain-containing protein [Azospirillaceae bacterium]
MPSRRPTLVGSLLLLAVAASAAPALAGTVCAGAGNERWRPYTYRTGDGLPGGAAHEMLDKAVAEAGAEYVVVDAGPWKRALAGLEWGAVDIVAAAVRNKEREADYLFTEPYAVERVLLISQAGAAFEFRTLEDLRDRSVILSRGVSYGDEWDRFAATRMRTETAPSAQEGFRMLAAGRAEFFVLAEGAVETLLADPATRDRYRVYPTPVAEVSVQAMIRRDSACAALIGPVNDALRRLRETGEAAALLGAHRLNREPAT